MLEWSFVLLNLEKSIWSLQKGHLKVHMKKKHFAAEKWQSVISSRRAIASAGLICGLHWQCMHLHRLEEDVRPSPCTGENLYRQSTYLVISGKRQLRPSHIVYSISTFFWVPNCASPLGTVPCSSNHLLPISANTTTSAGRSSLLAEIQRISRHLGNAGKWPRHTFLPTLAAVHRLPRLEA